MKSNSMNKITMYNVLSMVILQGITLFTSPLFCWMLGTTNYGIVAIYNTWVSIISIIFGLQSQSTIAVAQNEYSKDKQKEYQSSILTLSIVCYFVFSVVMLIGIDPLSRLMNMKRTMYLLMLVHGFGQFCVTFINFKFTYEFQADKNFTLSLVTSSCSVIMSMILICIIPKEINYWGRILGVSLTYMLLGILITLYILCHGKRFYVKEYWEFCIPLAVPVIVHNLSGLILNQSDRIMLQHSTTYSLVGIYSLAYSFGSLISTIWNALNNSWTPFYYDFIQRRKNEEVNKHALNYTELFTAVSAGFVLTAPEIYRLFAGREYWEGTSLIPVFVMGFYMIFLYSFPVNYEFYNKKTMIIATGTTGTAVINILLNCVLIQKQGMFGAALATAISYFLQYVFHCVCAKKIEDKVSVKYPFSFKMFLPYILFFYFVSIICYFVGDSYFLIRWGMGVIIVVFEFVKIVKRRTIF